MPHRKDRFGYGVNIPPTTARVVDTAVEILGDPDPGEQVDGGLLLKPSPPPIRRKVHRVGTLPAKG